MFPMVCYCTYSAFLDEHARATLKPLSLVETSKCDGSPELKQLQTQFARLRLFLGNRPEWKSPAQLGFAMSMALAVIIGIHVEYQLDLFGANVGRKVDISLLPLNPERAQIMLAPVTPQRDADKFFAVDMGTFLISDFVANRRAWFRQGENVITQCTLIPPH